MDQLLFEKAICYSGYRQGQSPKTVVPSIEEIREDLHIIANDGYKYIRMYDPNLHARRALEVIKEDNLPIKCMIGIDSDPEVNNPDCPFEDQHFTDEELAAHIARNDSELVKLVELVKEFDEQVLAVSIGNENTPVWGAHMVSEERLISHADYLHEHLNKPVTFCEGTFEWPNLTKLAEHLDFISVHSYPLHYGNTVDEAVALNKEHFANAKRLFPDKQVIFTEVGWTTMGNSQMVPGQACVENQQRYITELNQWLEEEQIIAFLFEAFDEPWKGSTPQKSECNWGLYKLDRTKKW